MKKTLILTLLIFSYLSCFSQQKGDSLAILYNRVYVYRNPDDLSSRLSNVPYSYYSSRKFTFLSADPEQPRYFKVLTPGGDTAFVRSKMVSADKTLSHEQIRQEVIDGIRSKAPGTRPERKDVDLPKWAKWLIFLSLLAILYLGWKKFYVLDNWFCRKGARRPGNISKPWFITYSLTAGLVIGAVELFSGKEHAWFIQEGFQLWGKYPSFWDWVMWGACVSVILIAARAVLQAFYRFPSKLAIWYSLLSVIIITVYFTVGVVVGAAVAVLVFLFAGRGSGSSSGSSGSSAGKSGSSSEPSGSIKTVNGQRFIKSDNGNWEYF